MNSLENQINSCISFIETYQTQLQIKNLKTEDKVLLQVKIDSARDELNRLMNLNYAPNINTKHEVKPIHPKEKTPKFDERQSKITSVIKSKELAEKRLSDLANINQRDDISQEIALISEIEDLNNLLKELMNEYTPIQEEKKITPKSLTINSEKGKAECLARLDSISREKFITISENFSIIPECLYTNIVMKWIEANRPDADMADSIAKAFINLADIKGDQEFIDQTRKLIQKASRLSTGSTILKRIVDNGKRFVIQEAEANTYVIGGPVQLSLRTKRYYYICLKNGERELVKSKKVTSLIHELLHLGQYIINPENQLKRAKKNSMIQGMDNGEEELIITGNLHIPGDPNRDFCSENSTLIELGYHPRINHQGKNVIKSQTPSFTDIINSRAIGNLKRTLRVNPQLGNKEPKILNVPLLLDEIMSKIIGTEKFSDPKLKEEWTEIINLLLKAGFKSEDKSLIEKFLRDSKI